MRTDLLTWGKGNKIEIGDFRVEETYISWDNLNTDYEKETIERKRESKIITALAIDNRKTEEAVGRREKINKWKLIILIRYCEFVEKDIIIGLWKLQTGE